MADRPILHGRDHARGGADPIRGLIQFDVRPQEGGFLEITATGPDGILFQTTGSGSGFTIYGDGDGIWIQALSGTADLIADGRVRVISNTDKVLLKSHTDIELEAGNDELFAGDVYILAAQDGDGGGGGLYITAPAGVFINGVELAIP